MNETTKHIDPLDTPHNPIISLGQDDQGREIEIMDNRDGTYTNLYMEIVFSDPYMCAFYSKQFAAKRQENCRHPEDQRETLNMVVGDHPSGFDGEVIYTNDYENVVKCLVCGEVLGLAHTITQEHVLIDEEVSNE